MSNTINMSPAQLPDMSKGLDAAIIRPLTQAEGNITVQSRTVSTVEANWEAAQEAISVLIKAKEERQKQETQRLAAEFGRVFDMCRMILQHPDLFPLTKVDIALPSYTYHCMAFVFDVKSEKIALTDSGALYSKQEAAQYWVTGEKGKAGPLYISQRLLEIIQEKATETL